MLKIAIVGATGNVGRHMIDILENSPHSIDLVPIASSKSHGQAIIFRDKKYTVQPIDNVDFKDIKICLFSAGEDISRRYASKATSAGSIVIDNTPHFRMDPDVPLVVPPVNHDKIKYYQKKRIIANPNCVVAQMVMALKPISQLTCIKRIVLTSLQSVSGAGIQAMDELFHQTKGTFINSQIPPQIFPKTIAFNVIPQIGEIMPNGITDEEGKIALETKKIMENPIPITATCVRVPVFVGHSISMTLECENHVELTDIRHALTSFPGVMVLDRHNDGGYITPLECVGDDNVYVSRIRRDPSVEHGLSMWIVADNLRRGAALNAIEIMDYILKIT